MCITQCKFLILLYCIVFNCELCNIECKLYVHWYYCRLYWQRTDKWQTKPTSRQRGRPQMTGQWLKKKLSLVKSPKLSSTPRLADWPSVVKFQKKKKEEQDKIWSRIPKGGPIPRRTGRLTVGRKKNSNSKTKLSKLWSIVRDWARRQDILTDCLLVVM
jgi:hypothetical protein